MEVMDSLLQIGLAPDKVVLIHEKHGNSLYRVWFSGKSRIVKWFTGLSPSEPLAYTDLNECGVPTLPVYAISSNIVVMEDLDTSMSWRKATREDLGIYNVGKSIAQWYKKFHEAGSRAIVRSSNYGREVDKLDFSTVMWIGKELGTEHDTLWKLCASHIEAVKRRMYSLPITLVYNDFDWSNLALSRNEPDIKAVMYDYHLIGIGLRYSDCRNVTGSLYGAAKEAFWSTYGAVDDIERILDEPTSILYALAVALQLPQFPSWANSLVEMVRNGQLEEKMLKAISCC